MMRGLFSPLMLVFLTACIQWAVLAQVGGFSVQMPYVGLAVVGALSLVAPAKVRAWGSYLRQNGLWIAPLAIYLVITLAVFWGTDGSAIAPRQIFFLVCATGFGVWLATLRAPAPVIRIGSGLGLLVFLGAIELQARRIGLSWADAATELFHGGNLKFVFYQFFTTIFNSMDSYDDVVIAASRKNDIAVVVLLLALLFRSASRRPERDIVGMLVMAGALVLLVMLNDRSVLIAAALSMIIATTVGARRKPQRNVPLLSLKMAALVGALVVAVGLSLPNSALSNTLAQRFSFQDSSTAGRLETVRGALAAIEAKPIAGAGYFEIDGLAIHNAFLGAWAYEGLIAFLLVLASYFVIFGRWAVFLARFSRDRGGWYLPLAPEWVAALPVVALFRVWLSGEGGIFKMGEWLSISCFFGCWLANRIQRQRLSTALIAHFHADQASRALNGSHLSAPARHTAIS